MALNLVLVLHGVASVEVLADVPSDIVAEAELSTRMQPHEFRDVEDHIVENDELLALRHHSSKLLRTDLPLESIDIPWLEGNLPPLSGHLVNNLLNRNATKKDCQLDPLDRHLELRMIKCSIVVDARSESTLPNHNELEPEVLVSEPPPQVVPCVPLLLQALALGNAPKDHDEQGQVHHGEHEPVVNIFYEFKPNFVESIHSHGERAQINHCAREGMNPESIRPHAALQVPVGAQLDLRHKEPNNPHDHAMDQKRIGR